MIFDRALRAMPGVASSSGLERVRFGLGRTGLEGFAAIGWRLSG